MTDVLEQPGRTRKPKTMQQGHDSDFQTDPWVLAALYPYLRREWIVWESAAGEGQLSRALAERGHWVIGSDVRTGQDFFTTNPPEWDVQITNPPYQAKDAWLERSYALGKPFALLLPLTTFEGRKRQELFRRHGVEVICLPKRPTFTTPGGKVGGSWFTCAWFTFGLGVGQALTFWEGGES